MGTRELFRYKAAAAQRRGVPGLSGNLKTAYIGIGSNLGDSLGNCLKAVSLIDDLRDCRVVKKSDFFLTEPVGVEGQEWYVNGAVSVSSGLSPHELLAELLRIEGYMGRLREEKWGPRFIDLDILLFGGEIIADVDLEVPHPLMHVRRFVLVPLVQLAPELVHPVQGLTLKELLKRLHPEGQQVMNVEAG